MKICIVGNSHTAAIKSAYDKVGAKALGAELIFFAARSDIMSGLKAVNGVLCARPGKKVLQKSLKHTSGGRSEINPEEFDLFVTVGLSRNVRSVITTAKGNYSAAAKDCAIRDFWEATDANKVVNLLREVTDKPVFVSHNPLIAARQWQINEVGANSADAAYESVISAAASLLFDRTQAVPLAQPARTIERGQFTKGEFSTGSIRLSSGHDNDGEEHPEGDLTHMNTAYGEIWLYNLMDVIKGHVPTL